MLVMALHQHTQAIGLGIQHLKLLSTLTAQVLRGSVGTHSQGLGVGASLQEGHIDEVLDRCARRSGFVQGTTTLPAMDGVLDLQT